MRTHSGHVCAFYASHSLGVPEKQPWCVVPKPASLSFLWSLGILNPIQKKNVPPFFWNYGCEYLVFLCICAHMNVNTPICTLCRWFLWGGFLFFFFVCLLRFFSVAFFKKNKQSPVINWRWTCTADGTEFSLAWRSCTICCLLFSVSQTRNLFFAAVR